MYYIGIDLGTSAVKLLLMDETGSIANIVSREYPIAFPHPGWSEQDPADWWAAVCDGIPALLDGFDASQVKGIGAGGQMHGLVVLDKNDAVIRPCILWNDGRTQRQVVQEGHLVDGSLPERRACFGVHPHQYMGIEVIDGLAGLGLGVNHEDATGERDLG